MNSLRTPARFRHLLTSLLLALALCAGVIGAASLPPAQAASNGYGFGPQSYKDGDTFGNGVYFAPYDFTIYTQPDDTSPRIGQFHWSTRHRTNSVDVTDASGFRHTAAANRLFFCYYPELNVAMMAVTGDNDQGWIEVIYDQTGHKTGWIRLKQAPNTQVASGPKLAPLDTGEPEHFGIYQTWQEFMKLNAKASGVYWLSGVNEYNRSIRYADTDDAKLIPVTIIRDLKVKHVRGNWLLVEVLDFERNTPIGWVRWRDDNGNLMVFPNISGQHMPIVTTAY